MANWRMAAILVGGVAEAADDIGSLLGIIKKDDFKGSPFPDNRIGPVKGALFRWIDKGEPTRGAAVRSDRGGPAAGGLDQN